LSSEMFIELTSCIKIYNKCIDVILNI